MLPDLLTSSGDFGLTCPRCGGPLDDRTSVDEDRGLLFYRLRFSCPACGYWLCTRLENFNVLCPASAADDPAPALPAEADQRIRLDLTHLLVRELMPAGVETYEAGRVWTSGEKTVSKTASDFELGGLHMFLALLANGYLERGDQALGLRAQELAVAALRAADKDDPALSDADPQNRLNAGRVLANLAQMYLGQGRREEARALAEEAYGWAPALFD